VAIKGATMTNETVAEVKTPKIRANSRMALLVELFKSGVTDIESLALKLKEAEEGGKILGLKKNTEEFKAKKDLAFYKKVVNWYLNQAKHKQLIDAPISARRLKSKKEVVAEVVAAATAEVQSEEVVEVSQSEDSSSAEIIPTI
jgi:hypothetical protein